MPKAPAQSKLEATACPLYMLRISLLLWTPDFIIPRPSNPHDPGPLASQSNLALLIGSNSPLPSTLDYIASKTCNLNVPRSSTAVGPPTTAEAEAPAYPIYTIWRISPPLWTLDFIAPGPSNPHDPGPSAALAVPLSLFSLHLIFSVIAIYALNDFLYIPPRSPSSAPVLICSVCL